jgi:hypothetical protein
MKHSFQGLMPHMRVYFVLQDVLQNLLQVREGACAGPGTWGTRRHALLSATPFRYISQVSRAGSTTR